MNDEIFPLVGYVLLFTAIPVGFIFVHLLLGKLIRPLRPHTEKGTVYECGEPTIGSAWVQFDLRYYVVALLFVIFDVEVAFFFPWAIVFGQVNDIARVDQVPATTEERAAYTEVMKAEADAARTRQAQGLTPEPSKAQWPRSEPGQTPTASEQERIAYAETLKSLTPAGRTPIASGPNNPAPTFTFTPEAGNLRDAQVRIQSERARDFSLLALLDILVFFGVLLLGFAYLWKRGDLAWVRSTVSEDASLPTIPVVVSPPLPAKELVLPAAH